MGAGSAAVDPALRAIWSEVLEVGELDVDDDFFALGGNSLLATQITARVADVLGADVPLDALFEAPTLGAYAERVREAGASAAADAGAPPREGANGDGGRRGLRGLLRGRRGGASAAEAARERAGGRGRTDGPVADGTLSHLQASAWSVDRYNPTLHPHVGETFTLQGPLDVAALERAFAALAARHEILRTSFPLVEHRPRARLRQTEPFGLETVGGGRRMRDAEVRRLVDAAWSETLDPASGPPWRVRLIRTGKSAHVLAFLLHEMLCDGQAYDLLVRELGALYSAEVAGEPSPLPEPAPQYRDVVRAHGPGLGGAGDADGPAHWRTALAGAPLALPLPHEDPCARAVGVGAYASRSAQLPAQLAERLRALAREEAATSFMLHLAAFYALLHRWSGETDLLVKSPAANRARVEWERIVGFFSIVLPLRVDAGGDPSFRTLLRRTRDVALAGFRHAAHVPEDNAPRELTGMRGLSGWAPMFRLWDPTTEQPLELAGVRAQPYRHGGERNRLALVVTERSDGRTVVELSSTAPELDARALGELLRQHERLLEQVAGDPDRAIGSGIELLSPAERDRAGGRAGGGASAGGARAGGGLHGLVAASAARAPDALAYDAGDGADAADGPDAALTYGELTARAAGLARLLRERGVADGDLVGVALPPGGALLTALLGVLRAGAVAVPLLDPGCEEDPLAGLPPLAGLVTGAGATPPAGAPAVVADLGAGADAAEIARGGAADAGDGAEVPDERPALVLRTAGVTDGAPRALTLTHGTLCRAALRRRDAQRLRAADRVAAAPGRGAWSWALAPWAALAAGATVVSPARAPASGAAASPAGWLEATAAGVAELDPPAAGAALERPAALPAALRLLCVRGAGTLTIPPEAGGRGRLSVQRWYGLAEAGGLVLAARAAPGPVTEDAPLAGEPAGLRARVVDRHGHVAPAGVAGELRLLDGERELPTGDLARRGPGGDLELLGRASDELRWRGVRLRPLLRELEAALAQHPGVQAAAACWEPRAEALVACIVPRRADLPAQRELDGWLQRTVADWVLPACYVAVEEVPRRPDGLPDRRALAAAPAVAQALATVREAAPRTPTERRLAEVWERVLGVRRPGAQANLFAQGGRLVDGVELVERARAAGIRIEPGDVMYRPTLAELAAIADERR